MSSPLDSLIKIPVALEPVNEFILLPSKYIADLLDKPEGKFPVNIVDQIQYLVSFFAAIISGFILQCIESVPLRKTFSTIMGAVI